MKYPLQVLIFAALNECYDYAFAALSQGQEAEYLGKCSLLPKTLNNLFLKCIDVCDFHLQQTLTL